MLNEYWVITAAHCVRSASAPCGVFAANQISLTANWPGMPAGGKTVQARALQIFDGTPSCTPPVNEGVPQPSGPTDIAILQVGLHDFIRPPNPADFGSGRTGPQLAERSPPGNSTVTSFGRGISTWAFWSGPPGASVATQTTLDGQYRSVPFSITNINSNGYYLWGGGGAAVAGGDSGGPSLYLDWDDPGSPRRNLIWRLVGVHSGCASIACLSGQSCPPADRWTWATAANRCYDASVTLVRNQILAAIEAVPPDGQIVNPFPSTPPEVLARPTALYAVNIDEPLVAAANVASGVELAFERCHERLLTQGCPLTPAYQTWSYVAATRQLIHEPTGMCATAFLLRDIVTTRVGGGGGSVDMPVGLTPCTDNTASQRWTRTGTSAGGNSPPWTFRNEQYSRCMTAKPGERPAGPSRRLVALTPAATLTLVACNGSTAQQFVDADADYARRAGPH